MDKQDAVKNNYTWKFVHIAVKLSYLSWGLYFLASSLLTAFKILDPNVWASSNCGILGLIRYGDVRLKKNSDSSGVK